MRVRLSVCVLYSICASVEDKLLVDAYLSVWLWFSQCFSAHNIMHSCRDAVLFPELTTFRGQLVFVSLVSPFLARLPRRARHFHPADCFRRSKSTASHRGIFKIIIIILYILFV